MAKRLRKQTVGELLEDAGVFSTWHRPDGIAIIVAQAEEGISLSNFLEAAGEDLEWGCDNEDFVRQLALVLGRLASAARVDLTELGEFIQEGYDDWEDIVPGEDDISDFGDEDTDSVLGEK